MHEQRDLSVMVEEMLEVADRMGATIREVNTSHVPFISRPMVVVKFIEEAAEAVARGAPAERGSR